MIKFVKNWPSESAFLRRMAKSLSDKAYSIDLLENEELEDLMNISRLLRERASKIEGAKTKNA